MSDWTAEPWEVEEGHYDYITANDGQTPIACMEGGEGIVMSLTTRRSNAARIVACVNGCAGLDPAAVPELVAVLEDLVANEGINQSVWRRARAALKRVRGEG